MGDLTNKNEEESSAIKYDSESYKDFKKEFDNKVPVYQGCLNESCYCSGACMKIIAYKDKDTGKIIDED